MSLVSAPGWAALGGSQRGPHAKEDGAHFQLSPFWLETLFFPLVTLRGSLNVIEDEYTSFFFSVVVLFMVLLLPLITLLCYTEEKEHKIRWHPGSCYSWGKKYTPTPPTLLCQLKSFRDTSLKKKSKELSLLIERKTHK